MTDKEKIELITPITREFSKLGGYYHNIFDILKDRFIIMIKDGIVYEPKSDNGVYLWVKRGPFYNVGPENMIGINRLKLWLWEEPFLSKLLKEYVSIVTNSREVAKLAEMVKAYRDFIYSSPINGKVDNDELLIKGIEKTIFEG